MVTPQPPLPHPLRITRAKPPSLTLTRKKKQQAQTLEQRRRNAKFAKDQEAKMGKSEDQLKKRTKETPKSPISLFWLGKKQPKHHTCHCRLAAMLEIVLGADRLRAVAVLAFVVFGGLVFELLSRFFGV
ncbi:hypothetical protein MKX07_006727 [Trichoderma sp. CBMAI-0711]|nr:hypothetical protein MKX07_006727 [Trichoderma sp. CBMAI-0711]